MTLIIQQYFIFIIMIDMYAVVNILFLVSYPMFVSWTVLIVLGFLAYGGYCSFNFVDSYNVFANLFDGFDQCGYSSYPIISLTNGSILLWKFQQINYQNVQITACFKFSDEVQSSKRYIGNLPSMGYKIPYILSKDHITNLQAMRNWRPNLEQGQYIYDVYISPNIIAVYVKGINVSHVDIYKTEDLSYMTNIIYALGVNLEIFVDNFDNIVFFNFVTNQVQIFYSYSSNYTNKKVVFIPNIVGKQNGYANIGAYRSGQISSKLMIYFVSQTHNTKTCMEVDYQPPSLVYNEQTGYNQILNQSLDANFTSVHEYSVDYIHFDCEQHTIQYHIADGCFKYNGECILYRSDLNMATCFKQKNLYIHYLDKIKLIVASLDPKDKNIMVVQIFEQSTTMALVLIIAGASLTFIAIVMIILCIVLRCKGITFKQFITCRWRKGKRKRERLQDQQKQSTMIQ